MEKSADVARFKKTDFSLDTVFRRSIKCILTVLISLMFLGCATTNIVKHSYSPRITAKEMKIRNDLEKRKKAPLFYILRFNDKRGIEDPSSIWKGKGIHEYRFENKTLSDYLFDSLIFDLQRVGMHVIAAEDNSIKFEDITSNTKPCPDNVDYVVSIDVYECIPTYKAEWSSVKALYNYDFHVRMWNTEMSRIVFDERIVKTFEGGSKTMIQFYDMTEDLLNDMLTRVNFDFAEVFMNSDSYEGKTVEPTAADTAATRSVVVNPNEPWTGTWKVGGSRHVAGPWALKQSGNKVKSTKKSMYTIDGEATGNRIKGRIQTELGTRLFFTVKMSRDGSGFKGEITNGVTYYIKGKRKK